MAEAGSTRKAERSAWEAACVECHSKNVRPSRSAYPADREKLGDGKAIFWRCVHCGARFLGPAAVEEKRRRRHRSYVHDPLAATLGFSRMTKRWVFPLFVLLVTALAVAFILDRLNNSSASSVTAPRR